MEAMRILSEIQNFHAVVDVETVLDLIRRTCRQGMIMVHCKDCIKTTQSSMITFFTLLEQCLPLAEALCSTYGISMQPGFFDSAMLAFEQPPSLCICLRSRVVLGQTELDEGESRLLIRILLGRGLMRLIELTGSLKGSPKAMVENPHAHRNANALRVCEASVESTISRLVVLMQIIEGEYVTGSLS
ncbi:hypothetical protein N7492_001551 [Penicillium capsulatum]|uniref:Uncharacterized protein n=1 Tax=Penicillium capsulatum TaxID=69766 RepID=A0A9W9ISK1_9EURO|nr:hypothetical protein N7492_001551 [Penicillium capsulatum]